MRLVKKPGTKPLLIVFEGIDGSGKTTQANMLAKRMQADGIPYIVTAEPSDGPFGRMIKSLGRRPEPEEEQRLFTEDRRDHVQRVILPALKQGRTVICDRYVHSSVAYQGARGMDPQKILAENLRFAPVPDIVFLLEISAELALSRIGAARSGVFSAFEDRTSLGAVLTIYQRMRNRLIHRLDGGLSPEDLHHKVVGVIRSVIEDLEDAERGAAEKESSLPTWPCDQL